MDPTRLPHAPYPRALGSQTALRERADFSPAAATAPEAPGA